MCLERQQYGNMPEKNMLYKNKLSLKYGLVVYEERIIVPKNLRITVISIFHEGQPAINNKSMAPRHFWLPRSTKAIQKKCVGCIPCKLSGKNIKSNLSSPETKELSPLSKPNEEIQLDFIDAIIEKNQSFLKKKTFNEQV